MHHWDLAELNVILNFSSSFFYFIEERAREIEWEKVVLARRCKHDFSTLSNLSYYCDRNSAMVYGFMHVKVTQTLCGSSERHSNSLYCYLPYVELK